MRKKVSILVLMDGWVKTSLACLANARHPSFNPCFNGWMGKDYSRAGCSCLLCCVSILVLMDGWVKTKSASIFQQ